MHRLLMMFSVVALLAGHPPTWAQEPPEENPSRQQAQEQMEIWRATRESAFARRALSAAHFVTGDRHGAELLLISTVAEPIQVALDTYLPHGERLPLGHYEVEPSQPLRLDLGELLSTYAVAAPVRGSLRLSFLGDEKALAAWLVQRQGSQVLEQPLQVASSGASSWCSFVDLPKLRPDADSFKYVLTNHGTAVATYRVRFGHGIRKDQLLTGIIDPGSQVELSADAGTLPRSFNQGWLVIEHAGASGELVVSGFLSGPSHLTALPMRGDNESLRSSYQAIRIPSSQNGAATFLLAHSPEREAHVRLSMLTATTGEATAHRVLDLKAGEPEVLEVERLFAVTPAGDWRLRVSADTPIAVSGFHRGAGGGVMDLAFFPDAYGHGTGSYPLPDPAAHELFTTIVNLGTESASVVGQIFWQGGSYAMAPVEVPAGASRRISHSTIIADAEPDLLGRTVPAGLRNGLFRWAAAGKASLIARTEARLLSGDDVYGFNCKSCCEQMPFAVLLPGDVEFAAGQYVGLEAAYYYETCTGGLMGPYPISQPQVQHVPAPFAWEGSSLTASEAADDEIGFEHEVWARSEICSGFWWNIWKWILGQTCKKTLLDPWSNSTACTRQATNCTSCNLCCGAQKAYRLCRKVEPHTVEHEYQVCIGLCAVDHC